MSTLEVACGKCNKRFRVRAEFAGKSTRCPGCSAAIIIAGARQAVPSPREEREERPRPRARRREEDEDQPAAPVGDWRPVHTALGREQVAVLFGLLTMVCGLLSICLLNMGGGPTGLGELGLVLALFLIVAPSLVAGTFGIMARISALRVPEPVGRMAAVSSLLCAIGAIVSLVAFGGSLLMSIDSPYHEPFPELITGLGVLFASLASAGTFAAFVAQVGIARRSDEVSAAFGRTAVGTAASLLGGLGLAFLMLLATEAMRPSYRGGYGYRSHDDERIVAGVAGLLMPIGLAVVLIMYHRLLGAAREAVRGD